MPLGYDSLGPLARKGASFPPILTLLLTSPPEVVVCRGGTLELLVKFSLSHSDLYAFVFFGLVMLWAANLWGFANLWGVLWLQAKFVDAVGGLMGQPYRSCCFHRCNTAFAVVPPGWLEFRATRSPFTADEPLYCPVSVDAETRFNAVAHPGGSHLLSAAAGSPPPLHAHMAAPTGRTPPLPRAVAGLPLRARRDRSRPFH